MKNTLLLILVSISFSVNSFGQRQLKIVEPVRCLSPKLGEKSQKDIERQIKLYNKKDLTKQEQIEYDFLVQKYGDKGGEDMKNAWTLINNACSWYCGGGSYKVFASSELKSQGKNNYTAKSANDFSYKTAWVEAKEDTGIGEYIEYSFKNLSPRITSIIISNGYMKSDLAWKNNNRVKSLKLYVNGKAHSILKLSDTKTDQEFKVGTLGHNPNGEDLVLRFEILEVYRGDKYNDTAITEIYFDGIDVH
jgi:hypothetical protein